MRVEGGVIDWWEETKKKGNTECVLYGGSPCLLACIWRLKLRCCASEPFKCWTLEQLQRTDYSREDGKKSKWGYTTRLRTEASSKSAVDYSFFGASSWILGKPVDQEMVTWVLSELVAERHHQNAVCAISGTFVPCYHCGQQVYCLLVGSNLVAQTFVFMLVSGSGIFNDALFALLISALQDDVCKERAEEKAPMTFCQRPGASFNNHWLPHSKQRYCYEYQEMNIRNRARVKARERVRVLGLRRRGGKQKAKGILTLQ